MSEATAAEDFIDARSVETTPPVASQPALPGCRLREAREARGLSVADVAGALKFGPRQIEALESDDYHSLQGATFLRGFVRSYARYLKLPPEPLLELLEAGADIERADVRPPEDTGVAMPTPGDRRLSPWTAGAILLGLLACGLLAWHLLSPQGAFHGLRDISVTESPNVALNEAVRPPQVRVEPAVAAAVVPGEASASPPALLTEGRQLVFVFSDRSWLEVRDASQRVVLSGEFPGGERQVVAGKPPFSLWIGRASAVRVLDGEREIDLKPHARDEVARLTVE